MQQVVRSSGHRNLPDIVGPWIERSDNPETYALHFASALALPKPWRPLEDLKPLHIPWRIALESILENADDKQQCIYANIQYYYQCRDSADAEDTTQPKDVETAVDPESEVIDPEELSEFVNGIKVGKVVLSQQKQRELEHAEEAVAIGQQFGLFGDVTKEFNPPQNGAQVGDLQRIITMDDGHLGEIDLWLNKLKQCALDLHSRNHLTPPAHSNDFGDINSLAQPDTLHPAEPTITYEAIDQQNDIKEINLSDFSDDQQHAFRIIQNHVSDAFSGKPRAQLLMQIQGEGGTGRSHVIAAVTNHFKMLEQESSLHRAAYTGIAASQVQGSTLHQLALLHLGSKPITKKVIQRLIGTWSEVRYLIIDEVSMISKHNLGVLSEMIGKGKQCEDESNSTVPFGGVNVVIAGDFHQFPPVIRGGSGRGALYSPAASTHTLK